MQTRRLIAAAIIVVVVIALALLIKSCDSSATTSALKNYNANVYNLISASDTTGGQVFNKLTSGNLSNVNLLASQVQAADSQLRTAQGFHAPSQMARAQSALVNVMQLRAQAIQTIAAKAPQAANKNTSKDALYNISIGTSELYASDVLYKAFVATDIAKALNANNIPVGSAAGEQQINAGQILPDLGWLQQSWIATKIGAQETTAQANANNVAPGIHGHILNFVTVDGTEIYSGSNNTIPVSRSRTWVLNVTNGGDFNEYQVGCSVKIEGLNDSGSHTLPVTVAHKTYDCTVTLPAAPTPGTYTVVASVTRVPGEVVVNDNKLTYSVTFN